MSLPREAICRYDCHDYESKSYTKVVGYFYHCSEIPQLFGTWLVFIIMTIILTNCLCGVCACVCVWAGGIHYSSNGIINWCWCSQNLLQTEYIIEIVHMYCTQEFQTPACNATSTVYKQQWLISTSQWPRDSRLYCGLLYTVKTVQKYS